MSRALLFDYVVNKGAAVFDDEILSLIKARGDINHYDVATRHTALSYAISHDFSEKLIRLLLNCKACPNIPLYPPKNRQNVTAISLAVYRQQINVLELLIQAGGSANCSTFTPWDLSVKAEDYHPQPGGNHELEASIHGCRDALFPYLLDYKFPVSYIKAICGDKVALSKLYRGFATPLFLSAKAGYIEAVEAILDAGASVLDDQTGLAPTDDAMVENPPGENNWNYPVENPSKYRGCTVLMAAVEGDRLSHVADSYDIEANEDTPGDKERDLKSVVALILEYALKELGLNVSDIVK